MSSNYMQQMQASIYSVKSSDNLGLMLIRGRLNYILVINEDQFGSVINFDDSQYQKVEILRSEGYHYIHKKHAHLLPKLTKALQLAIEQFGSLVKSEPVEN